MKSSLVVLFILAAIALAGCARAEPTPDAVALEATVAQRIFATLTASAPTATPVPSATPTATSTLLPPTSTPTITPPVSTPTPNLETAYIQAVREIRGIHQEFDSGTTRLYDRMLSDPFVLLDRDWQAELATAFTLLDKAEAKIVLLSPPPTCNLLHQKVLAVQEGYTQSAYHWNRWQDSKVEGSAQEWASALESAIVPLQEIDRILQRGSCR